MLLFMHVFSYVYLFELYFVFPIRTSIILVFEYCVTTHLKQDRFKCNTIKLYKYDSMVGLCIKQKILL